MGDRSELLDGFGDDFAWSLFDAAPDGILVVAESGEIAFASDQAAILFGCSTAELVGAGVDELLPEDLRARHRAHRNRYRARPEVRLMGAGLELRARRRDGSEFFAEISLSPFPVGDETFVVAAVRDISQRVTVEDHLRRVLSSLDASDDAIFMFDADTLQYLHVNDGAVRLVGYDRDELVTMTPVHLNPYTSEAEYRTMVDHLLADPTATEARETRLLRKDGTEVPVEKTYRAAPTARDGSRWIVAVARDISARLAAEAELRASQDLLQEAEQAVMLADDRDRIARDLHDTVIQRLFAAGLSLQAIAATADDRIRDRLETTVDDLDTTIKELRAAIFSLQTRHGPGGLRGRLLEVATDEGAAIGIEPRLQLDGPIDALGEDIAEQLIPTLREALSNVAKHAQASTVRVIVTVGDDVCLTVVDDGVGVSGEVLGGNGLANMTRRAEKLGGTADLAPGPDGGARFTWRVPLELR
jgi:two-component system sensor histidine kinase DevS